MFDGNVFWCNGSYLNMFNFFNRKPTGHTITFLVKGMHCVSCSMNIDGELEDMKGIATSNTSYVKGKTVVTFDPTLVSETEIITAIKKLGYSAEVENT